MTLTHNQFLEIWRRANGFDPRIEGCSMERFDSIDVDTQLSMQMRQWYLNLLDTAPLRHLVLTDIAPQLSFKQNPGTSWFAAKIPANVRRIISVWFSTLPLPVDCADSLASPSVLGKVLATDDPIPLSRPWASPASCAPGQNPGFIRPQPKALVTPEKLLVNISGPLLGVYAVVDPGDESYVFNESALSLIPSANVYC